MSKHPVKLRLAFEWTCPDCGHFQLHKNGKPHEPGYFVTWLPEGYFMLMPGMVFCENELCGNAFNPEPFVDLSENG